MALAIDPTAVTEPAELRQHLEDGYAELLDAAGLPAVPPGKVVPGRMGSSLTPRGRRKMLRLLDR